MSAIATANAPWTDVLYESRGGISNVVSESLRLGVPATVTYSRAGTGAGYLGSDNAWHATGANVARIDSTYGMLCETVGTNSIHTNDGTGAANPSTLPTNWSITLGSGLSRTVVGTGTENGIAYTDIRINGTSSGVTTTFIFFSGSTEIAAVAGDTWTLSSFLKITTGDMTGIASIKLNMTQRTSGGSITGSQAGAAITPTSAALGTQRNTWTATITGGTTAAAQPNIAIASTSNGVIDITLRIGMPQYEKFGFATSPIKTSTGAVTRNADVATRASVATTVGRTPSGVSVTAITAPGSGTQVLWEQSDGTENNRVRLYRDSSNVLHALATVSGTTAVDMQLGTVANSTSFTATVSWDAAGNYSASLNGTTGVNTTGTAAASGMNTIYLGADSAAANNLNGWVTLTMLEGTNRPFSAPQWVDGSANFSMDFANQRYFNLTPANLNVDRPRIETAYDSTGALVSFESGVAVLPAYNPNASNAPLGLGSFQSGSQWLANSLTPATQTVTPTVSSKYIFYCFGSGSCTLSGGMTGTINGSDASKGFIGVGSNYLTGTLDGSTSVTVTVTGTITFFQLTNLSPTPFPLPQITKAIVPATQSGDILTIDMDNFTGLFNATEGTFITRFFPTQFVIGGTMMAISDGTTDNRMENDYKVTPTHQAGISVISGGVNNGGVDPAPGNEVSVQAYYAFAWTYSINGDFSGRVAVAMNGIPSVIDFDFPAGEMPTGTLHKLTLGADEGGIKPLDGYIQRLTYIPFAVDDARLLALSGVTGP